MSIIPSKIFDPFDLDLWDPFYDIRFNKTTAAAGNANVDWKETPKAHVFKTDLPGIKKEEVKVTVEDGNVLNISGERSREKDEESGTWHRIEGGIGKFMRRFRLPKDAKVDKAEAAMENGVLTVTVPKEEVKEHDQVKAIDISG